MCVYLICAAAVHSGSGIKKEVAVKPDGVDFQTHDLRLGTTIEDRKILCHVNGIKKDCSVNE